MISESSGTSVSAVSSTRPIAALAHASSSWRCLYAHPQAGGFGERALPPHLVRKILGANAARPVYQSCVLRLAARTAAPICGTTRFTGRQQTTYRTLAASPFRPPVLLRFTG